MRQEETEVDVSGDSMRYFFSENSGPHYIPGTRIDINIPFTGEEWIFRFRTNPFSFSLPHAEVSPGKLGISISLPHDMDSKAFGERYQREMSRVRECVQRSHKQVANYNDSLPRLAEQAISARRERLSKHADIAALLDIPLAAKAGAPSIAPVRVDIRRPPRLPVPPKTGLKPEPGITDETYERILQLIRHQGRTFETAPATFSKHNEEGLRDIVLAQLNGHFEGAAAGEVFRRCGKTDIRIEQDSRAAFVGECKVWAGPSNLTEALDQLLGYLTWRDGKASVIIFNSKNKNFSKIREVTPKTLQTHPLFLRNLQCREEGEWRIQMRSKEDEGRRVTVHIFAFDIYQSEN